MSQQSADILKEFIEKLNEFRKEREMVFPSELEKIYQDVQKLNSSGDLNLKCVAPKPTETVTHKAKQTNNETCLVITLHCYPATENKKLIRWGWESSEGSSEYGVISNSTINRAVFIVALSALKSCEESKFVEFRSDNSFFCNCLNKFISKWVLNGYKKSNNDSVANLDVVRPFGDCVATKVFRAHFIQDPTENDTVKNIMQKADLIPESQSVKDIKQ